MVALAGAVCLVTGATGFLGTELVRCLLADGVTPDRLRCLVRDPAVAAARGLPVASLRAGDVGDPQALRAAAADVDCVFHLAGTIKAPRAARYFAVNRDGTQNLVDAVAAVARPDAFTLLMSSLAAAGPSADGVGSDLPADRCRPVSAYGESKRQGELAVAASPRPYAIVRPPVVYGARDAATRLLFAQARAPLCPVPPRPRPLSVVHVSDVVAALLRAAEVRPHGAVLPLDGPERTDTHALLRAIAAVCGRKARLLPVPLGIAAAAASLCDFGARLLGRTSFFNGDKVKELAAAGWVADAGSTRALLGWAARVHLDDGLRDVALAEGWLPRVTSAAASAAPSARGSGSRPGRR